jgi:hypothetical protein
MKRLLLVGIALSLVIGFSGSLQAQAVVDTGFTIAATIKPSTYAQWPDSVGAEKVQSGFDINANGKKEFIVMADPYWVQTLPEQRPYIFWFEASGDNTYNLLWSAVVPGLNNGDYQNADFTVADVDKDGKMEILVAVPRHRTGDDNAILYLYEFDNGAFPSQPTITSDLGVRAGIRYSASRIEVADVDGDGDNEVVVTSRRDDYGGTDLGRTLIVTHFFGGDINPATFGYFEQEFIDSSAVLKGGAVYDMGITDFDGSGKKEIWVSTWDLLSLAIYEATAKDTYVLRTDINQARPDNDVGVRHSMRWYDANKDGKLEYYCAGITDATNPGNIHMIPSTTSVATLTTASVFTLTSDLEPIDEYSYEGADIGDVNGDGKMDYIVAGAGPRREVFWLQYKGTGSPSDSTSFRMSTLYKDTSSTTTGFSYMTINIGNDIDGDGKREVFIPNRYTRTGVATDPAVIILEAKRISSGVDRVEGLLPEGYSLGQNYPNPFNPETALNFTIPSAGRVTLTLHNALGELITTVVDAQLEPGVYSAKVQGGNLPSGTYFYTLRAGNFVDTKKMLLLK